MKSFLKSFTKREPMWKYVALGLSIIIIFTLIFFTGNRSCSSDRFDEELVTIPDGTVLQTAKADSITERAQGLSICNRLSEDQSMLFVFSTSDIYSFWMKDMKFPIDIIWLDEHKQVVFIKEDARPEEYRQGISYVPDVNARYVIETVSGFTSEHQISIGNQFAW